MHSLTPMRSLCLPLILLALACNKESDDEKLRKSIVSWNATLQIVADARLNNEVRDGFALKTIDEAVDDLESAKTTSKSAEQLIGIAAKLREAIERGDRAAIAQVRQELAR
ncbi:MAG TPA: hypothetical protein VGQ46_15610 [Thermoanaerobaculia bacterium]|jgi:hypothetical protein|nr:hypothetical protein [Thermoanaerobaculia bacterium]